MPALWAGHRKCGKADGRFRKAAQWFETAAENRHLESMFMLGKLYYSGLAKPKGPEYFDDDWASSRLDKLLHRPLQHGLTDSALILAKSAQERSGTWSGSPKGALNFYHQFAFNSIERTGSIHKGWAMYELGMGYSKTDTIRAYAYLSIFLRKCVFFKSNKKLAEEEFSQITKTMDSSAIEKAKEIENLYECELKILDWKNWLLDGARWPIAGRPIEAEMFRCWPPKREWFENDADWASSWNWAPKEPQN